MRRVSLLVILCLLAVSRLSPVRAAAGNPWLAGMPTIGLRETLASTQLPETIAFAGNIPCDRTHFIVRPPILPLQTEKVETACAVMTAYGPVAPGGFVHILDVTARLYSNGGGAVQLYSIPHQRGAVLLESTASGNRLQYYPYGAVSSRREWTAQTGEWKFYLANQGLWTLKDKAGNPLYIRSDSIAFSNNGRYMVADSEHVAKIRVDLQTGAVIPFDVPYAYHLGTSVTPQLAITDDGNTVLTTSDRGDVTITDISSCSTVPASIQKPVTCPRTTYDGWLRQQFSGYYRAYQPRFVSSNQISLYISHNSTPTKRILSQVRLLPPGQSLDTITYLALGDSFTSGEGAYDYYAETDTAENKCHLSRQSYPYLLGKLTNAIASSVACSGARIDDLISHTQKPVAPPGNSLGELLPGIKPQLQYVQEKLPSILTISIGGNDIGFGDKQKQCLAPGTCLTSREDRQEMVDEIDRQLPRLTSALRQARQAARSEARVYTVGYPQVADDQGSCPLNVPLDAKERQLTQLIITYLNSVIAAAAAQAGVGYISVDDAFTNHRLCESSSGTAMNGLVVGDDLPFAFGPLGNESFHPNQLGHRLYAATLMSRSFGLSAPMLASPQNSTLPDATSRAALLNAPSEGRRHHRLYFRPDLVAESIRAGDVIQIDIPFDDYMLKPHSSAEITLHSEVTHLDSVITDAAGRLSGTIRIPQTMPAGWHTLHIIAEDVFGRSADIYKTFYVSDGTPICYAYGNRNCNMKDDSKTDSPGAPPVTNPVAAPQTSTPASNQMADAPKPEPTQEKDQSRDEVLAAEASQQIRKEAETVERPIKKKGRLRQFFSSWWHNKRARWGTIIAIVIIITGVIVYPRSRYMILNSVGVRSSASVTVIDNETRQPLKNVLVQLHNAQATTNNDGYAKLEGVRLGETTLVVTRKAFAPLEKDVTVGWGSNPYGEVLLEPKGLQYSFIVKDFLSGKPIEKAEAISSDASAFSDKDGKLVLTLDTTSEEPVEITIKADGYRTDKITETSETTNNKEVRMVPAQEQAFISKRSGTYDLYKIYADGTGEALVLSGTGSERDDIALVPQPTGNNVALVSTRDNQRSSNGNLLSTLNIVNITDSKVTKLDSGDSIQVVGWIDNTVIYIVVSEQPANGAKKQRLLSYNTETGQKLDITSANYFNAAMVAGDKVYYAPAADIQVNGGTNATTVGFFMSDATGTNTKRLLEQEVWNMVRSNYDTIAFSTGKDWYEYKLGTAQTSRIGGAPADQKTRIYTNNGANSQSLWIDQRDGKGVLISYDLASKQDKVLTGQSGLVYPVRWLNDTTAVYRIHSSDETADYVVSTNGGEPKKIVNVTNTAGVDKWYYY